MTDNSVHNLIIIGSGPAAYTAAVYAARANLNPVIITGREKGGQLMTTTDVDNWPGDIDGLQGPDLMDRLEKHAKRFNTKIIFDHINKVDFKKKPFTLFGDEAEYQANAVIIATGASAKYLGMESETKFKNKGVSACATCDGFFYKDQDVAVIGGGNTAAEEALFLSKIAKSVTLVHRRDKLRAEPILADKVMAKDNIKVMWNTLTEEITGNDEKGVTGLRLKDKNSGKIEEIAVTGVFVAIGHQPNTQIFQGQLKMNDTGYIIVHSGTKGNATATSVDGVFAAGDVSDPIYRQAITSAGAGCMAALDAQKFLEGA